MPDKRPASPEPLILPRGIRFPHPHELPPGTDGASVPVDQSQITTGYRLLPSTGGTFAAFVEANVHANNVFTVFYDLALTLLPRVAAPILAIRDGETCTGPVTIRAAAIRVFQPHIEALQHDAFLGFGLIYQGDGTIEQIFVQPSKQVQIWTNAPDAARAVLARHQIPEVPDLQVLDQFPLVRQSLENPDGNDSWPEVLAAVRAACAALPPPDR